MASDLKSRVLSGKYVLPDYLMRTKPPADATLTGEAKANYDERRAGFDKALTLGDITVELEDLCLSVQTQCLSAAKRAKFASDYSFFHDYPV